MTAKAIDPPAVQASPSRFLALDGLRGVAAFAVILDHVPQDMVNGLLPGRALSVDFFFVLSGFVLAHAYGERLRTSLSPLNFMQLRLIRLYPLYLLGLMIALPLGAYPVLRGWGGPEKLSRDLVSGLLMLPSPPVLEQGDLLRALYPLDGPAWSLFYELVANLAFAISARFLSLRALACVLPVFALALVLAIFHHIGEIGPGWRWLHADAGLSRAFYGFFTGVFLFELRKMWRPPRLPVWLAIVIFLALISVPASGLWRPTLDAIITVVFLPLLVFVSADTVVSGAMARVCATLGWLSYGIYVLQVPLLGVLTFLLQKLGVDLPGVIFIALVIFLAVAAAWLATRFYDGPIRAQMLKRLVPSILRSRS